MSAPRGHRAETGRGRVILAGAPHPDHRPDRKDSPREPCAAAGASEQCGVGVTP